MLKVIRESIGLTQEQFAEHLGADTTTIQGWETGRRPLMAMPLGSFLRLRHVLVRMGTRSQLITQLETALEADRFIGYVMGCERNDPIRPDHLLATWVITRRFTDLLVWPFTQQPPSVLADASRTITRRGPVATAPRLLPEERAHFFDHLKMAAERADIADASGLLLRRQARYVAGFDDRPDTAEWLRHMQKAEERRAGRSREWTPAWAVIRSGAHSLARLGDREGLRHFIRTRLADEPCEVANLNYWAYWLGEVPDSQTTDLFMVELRPEQWRGTTVLRHLAGKLDMANPYVDVVVHTIWALVMLCPSALHGRLSVELEDGATRMLDEPELSSQARRELEAVLYALRMIHRG
ncbi:helix-turn-helix domain-containing protein [Thermoactinospora rubra]|uniref:helix-turn-helix domain-containing protein n=1 Tax=Thermoactinospora rubra TaxID=1088767 RepID=UPI001F0A645E|nr:helix-turn-helix domain-containing protein [Thermoactinospora rubra]